MSSVISTGILVFMLNFYPFFPREINFTKIFAKLISRNFFTILSNQRNNNNNNNDNNDNVFNGNFANNNNAGNNMNVIQICK